MILTALVVHNPASAPILIITFISMLVLIALNKFDKAVLALGAAAITLFVLSVLEGVPLELSATQAQDPANRTLFQIFISLVFGDISNDFEGFQTIMLILGMMFIVEIAMEGGVFQMLSFRLIQLTKGKPIYLLMVFCTLCTFITALMNDILTVILLIPLTITVCRILNIEPLPYIICQAIVIKMGASMLLISSIPNILVASYLNLDFSEFFLNFGFTAIMAFILAIIIFFFFFRTKLKEPRRGIEILLEFNVWNFVPDKKLMYKSVIVLLAVIFGFVFIPTTLMTPGMIAFTGAIVLFFICKVDAEELMKKIDFKLILYLIGIFTISGGMEFVGVITEIGNYVATLATGDPYSTFILAIWLSAGFSAFIDNIPIARILIPTIGTLTMGMTREETIRIYSGLTYGVNWGDSLTPFGDTMLVINVTETNKVKFPLIEFVKVGLPTTLIQLWAVTVVYSLIERWQIGLILLGITIGIGFAIFNLSRYLKKNPEVMEKYKQYKKSFPKKNLPQK